MSSDSIEDKYPSWRDAIKHNANLINLKCTIEYIFWHTVYAAIALIGIVVVGGAFILSKIGVPRVLGGAKRFIGSERLSNIMFALLGLFAYASLVITLAFLMVMAVKNPVMFAIVMGAIVFYAALVFVGFFAAERYGEDIASTASKAGRKATETPGIRRIWGRCPVNLGSPPKWFDNIFGEDI